MLRFHAVALATVVCIFCFPKQDITGVHCVEGDVERLRTSRLLMVAVNVPGSGPQTAKKVTFYYPKKHGSVDRGLMRAYNGSYEVCGRILNCVSHTPVDEGHRNMNRVVIVTREGFLDLVQRFPLSAEYGLDLINIVIWDQSENASEICNWVGVVHNATVAVGRDEVRRCYRDSNVSRNQSWSALSGTNVTLGCGTCMELELCSIFRVKVLAGALAVVNATVINVSLDNMDAHTVRSKADALGLIMLNQYISAGFVIEPELILEVSFYFYVDSGRVQKNSFFGALVANFITFGCLFLAAFSVAALFLVVTRILLSKGLDDMLLLLFSHLVATAAEVSSRSLRPHSRRVLVVFWALACLAFAVYVRCLLTAEESIPTKVKEEGIRTVVQDLIRRTGGKVCLTGEEIVYGSLATYEDVVSQISGASEPCSKLQARSCFRDLRRGNPAAAFLFDTPSCEIKRMLGDSVFKVSKDRAGFHGGIPITRSSPKRFALKAIIGRIFETGWFEREYSRYTRSCRTPLAQHEMSISFGSFLEIYLWCCLTCALVFLLECVALRLDGILRSWYFG